MTMPLRKLEDHDLQDQLRQLPVFDDLPDQAVELVAQFACRSRVYKGQTIIEEGEPGGDLLFLLQGRVGVCLESISPSVEIGINRLGPGDVIGEMSYLQGGPRSATVIALENCELALIPTVELKRVLADNPEWDVIFHRNLALTLCRRIRTMNRRILNISRNRLF